MSTNTVDPWEQSSEPTLPTKSYPIPDDWDNDEEDEDNETIWENANSKPPMPELITSRPSTGATVVLPPTSAIQSPLRILKRPSPASNNSSSSESPSAHDGSISTKSLAEREANYQAARERIFGDTQDDDHPTAGSEYRISEVKHSRGKDSDANNPSPSPSMIVRNPSDQQQSPKTSGCATTPKGFCSKRGRRNSKTVR